MNASAKVMVPDNIAQFRKFASRLQTLSPYIRSLPIGNALEARDIVFIKLRELMRENDKGNDDNA
jgi:hypothetical protein